MTAAKRPLEPTLVEPHAVRVDARDDRPAVTEPVAQVGVSAEGLGQVKGGQSSDGLVRVNAPENQGLQGTISGHAKGLDGLAEARTPYAGDRSHVRVGLGQATGLSDQLVNKGEIDELGDRAEPPG